MHIKRNVLKRTELLKEQLVLGELNKVLLEVRKRLGRHIKDHGDVFDLNSKGLLAVINSRFSHKQHSLDVENKLVLSLMKHGVANSKSKNSPNNTQPKGKRRRHGIKQEDITHKLEVVVHGVHNHKDLDPM